MNEKLILQLQNESIEVYEKAQVTPLKLLEMYEIAVDALEVNLATMKLMFDDIQNQEKSQTKSNKIKKLVKKSDNLRKKSDKL
jgi:hypothetical protein